MLDPHQGGLAQATRLGPTEVSTMIGRPLSVFDRSPSDAS
jgi:hypothetical protein